MPSLADHHSSSFTKLLLGGDAKVGKTTSLASLVPDYKLRILDFDNLLDGLRDRVLAECPNKIGNVEFVTIRDKYKAGPTGPMLDGPAKAFITAMKLLDHWKYDDVDLGKPKEWGPDTILVIDGLTRLCDAAYAYHQSMAKSNADGRAIFFDAQKAVEMVLSNLTSDNFETNVILICHCTYQDLPDGTTKIFPAGIGQKLSPKIPSYFPVYVRYKNTGEKRTIQIKSDVMIDLAMPRFDAFAEKTLPVETGLATIFSTLRGKPPIPQVKPKAVTLQRRV
jgi:AAA domain